MSPPPRLTIAVALFTFGSAFARAGATTGVPRVTPLSERGAPSPRAGHTAVWTGHEVLIWGGDSSLASEGAFFNDGAAYEPERNRWRALPSTDAPTARSHHVAAWTGAAMIVWGGRGAHGALGDGASFELRTGQWHALPREGAPSPRQNAIAVWTGKEVIIWGGATDAGTLLADGARWRPGEAHWRRVAVARAPSPRADASAVWTGRELVIWGGGAEQTTKGMLDDGAAYDPEADRWRPIAKAGAATARMAAAAVWSGTEVLIFGGKTSERADDACDGAAYDPVSDRWRSVVAPGCLSRGSLRAAWTQKGLLVVGEPEGDTVYPPREGAFLPQRGPSVGKANAWQNFRVGFGWPEAAAVWTGRAMLLWGGFDGTNVVRTGVRIIP